MEITFGDALKAGSIDSLKSRLIDKRLNRTSHEAPSDWFKDGEKYMNLGRPTEGQITRFSEMKASRDVLEHRGGIVDATYRLKAGVVARYTIDGERIEIPENYLRGCWTLIKTMVAEIGMEAAAKFAR